MAITLNFAFLEDGTYTLEDDGTPGNGTSVLRRPDGTIISTFAHPADALTIISRPGQHLNINITDSLTTANFTVGSLTDPSTRPSSIQIGGVLTSGTVTLTTGGAITEWGSDGATDIVAGKLFMDAVSGIGKWNAIETQTSVLEAENVVGDINLSNINSLTIGGAGGTGDLRGLFTESSGNITLVNQGSITLADTDGVESVHSAGSLTLNALGNLSDIASSVNRDALLARGNIFLNAGRDVLFGRTGADFDNDVRAGGSIYINAGRDFAIDGFSDMAADDLGLATGGGVSIIAGRDLLIDDAFGVDASISVSAAGSTGSVYLQTGVGGTMVLHANSSAAIQGRNGGVIIAADRLLIENDSGINVSGTGSVSLTTQSAGRAIDLGSATDGFAALEISDAELDRVVASNVVVGGSLAGQLTVSGTITSANNFLSLRSGGDIVVDAHMTTVQGMSWVAGESIWQSALGQVTTGAFSASVDQPDTDPDGGILLLDGTFNVTGSTLSGNADNDSLVGTANGNRIEGNDGNDVLRGLGGNDTLIGGNGTDTVIFAGNRVDYLITPLGGSEMTFEDRVLGRDARDAVRSVEFFQFADQTIALSALLKTAFQLPANWTAANSGDAGWHVGDFNGDLKDDVFRVVNGVSGAQMFLSNGSSFVSVGSWTGADDGDEGWYVGDFDGDGRDDLLRVDVGVSGADMHLSNGTTFVSEGSWTTAGSGDVGWHVGDFNGDGRDDIFRYREGISGAEVFLSNGSSFVSAGSWTAASNGDEGWYIGDFNGDGKDDIFRYVEGVSGAQVFVSTGTSFVLSGSWTGAGTGDDGWYVADYNGDGRDDVLRYRGGASGAEVFLSDGGVFNAAGSWSPAGNGTEGWHVGDFTGDGTADLMRVMPSGAEVLI